MKTIIAKKRKSPVEIWAANITSECLLNNKFDSVYKRFVLDTIENTPEETDSLTKFIAGKEKFANKICDIFGFAGVAETEDGFKFVTTMPDTHQ